MAQKRMFSKKITDTDKFLDMPLSTQALYFHLNMDGDDDGFVSNTKTIKRKIGASDDDLKILVAKQFIIPFDSGVIVIKDWRIHNTLQNDRYKPTIYVDEKRELETKCFQNVSKMFPQHNITKHNITKHNKDTLSSELDCVSEIVDYLNLKTNRQYRKNSDKTKRLIKTRMNDGFTIDDFKRVIDNKSTEWINNSEMNKFLRPETLFGTKFESYLNEQQVKPKGSLNIDGDVGF